MFLNRKLVCISNGTNISYGTPKAELIFSSVKEFDGNGREQPMTRVEITMPDQAATDGYIVGREYALSAIVPGSDTRPLTAANLRQQAANSGIAFVEKADAKPKHTR